jgi:uncharacterized membrane protein YhaH (DUF805 family)
VEVHASDNLTVELLPGLGYQCANLCVLCLTVVYNGAMAEIKVKSQTLPERCDICHKADYFDPKTGQCSRCAGVERSAFAKIAPPILRKMAYPLTQLRIANLGIWEGTISRAQYLSIGSVLFLIKRLLDFIVVAGYDQPWSFFSYLSPFMILSGDSPELDPNKGFAFYMTLLTVALPFIWAGVVLTLRRLRATQLPTWLIILFFVPVLNLLFFLVLAALPTRQEEQQIGDRPTGRFARLLDKAIPRSALGSAIAAVAITLFPALLSVFFSVSTLKQYGSSLFVLLPFCLGFVSTLIYGFHQQRSFGSCMLVSSLSILTLGVALIGVAMEGLICLIMASPIAFTIAAIGGSVGYAVQRRPVNHNYSPLFIIFLFLSVPALMGAEYKSAPEPPLIAIQTAIEIDAAPELVWQKLLAFSKIKEPDELLFKVGIAYPTEAKIVGKGVGAVRYCSFSTGSFVEPIEVWDEPNLLKFSVAAQPLSMQEWTPYKGVHPPHLDKYLQSQAGQFLLTRLPDGRTRIEGTTWYRHNIWPAAYWRLWSDFIIQRIHLRVLNHIKHGCEQQSNP